jgi:hypothetical protein
MSKLFKQKKLLFATLFIISALSISMLANVRFALFIPVVIFAVFLEGHFTNRITRFFVESIPLAFFILSIILSFDLFYTLTDLLILIMISKIMLFKEKIDYYEIFVVGFMVLVLASVSTISITFSLLLFFVFLTGSLMLIYANFKGGEPDLKDILPSTILFSIISYALSFAIFFSVPRLSLGFVHGNSLFYESKSGFSDTVKIDNSKIQLDNTVIMRIETKITSTPLYVSALRYSIFTGKEWIRDLSTGKIYPQLNNVFGSREGSESTVYLEPTGTNVLFGIDRMIGVRGDFLLLFRDSLGDFLTDTVFYRTIKYDVFSDTNALQKEKLTNVERTKFTQLPHLSSDFTNLVFNLIKGKISDEEKVQSLLNYLNSNCKYSLTPNYNSIEDFVLKGGEGFCEHFATAFAIMSRVSGIPSRLVSGYATSELNQQGEYYVVRNKDAHTWVEVYINGNWMRVDPTPKQEAPRISRLSLFVDSLRMSWYRNIVTYDMTKQFEFVKQIGGGINSISVFVIKGFEFLKSNLRYLIVLILIAPLFVLFIKKPKRNDYILSVVLSLIGDNRLDSETVDEFAKRKKASNEVFKAVHLYYRYRFKKDESTADQIIKLSREIKSKKHYLTN